MLRVNARHRAAHANSRRHEFDNFPLWLEFFGDSLHQIELGADKPASVRRGGGDGFNDVFRGTDFIGQSAYFLATFRVGNNKTIGMFFPKGADVFGTKHLVHRAKTLPQDNFGAADFFFCQSALWLVKVPHRHIIGRHAHCASRPSAQVLVGKKSVFSFLS